MFTGIVEEMGVVLSCEPDGDVHRLVIQATETSKDLGLGGSVAVNGCCLTATSVRGDVVTFDLARETMVRTRFDQRLGKGSRVNLERPLRLSARLDGHFVQGHVDGVAAVALIEDSGSAKEITFDLPQDLARYCVEKGSIAIDGVSLTCVSVAFCQVKVALIPHTLEITTLGGLKVADLVNVEVDMIAKYVEKLLTK